MSQCKFCSNPISRRNAIICGAPPCKRQHRNQLQRARRAAERKGPTSCIVCGTPITTFSICSDACRLERKRQRKKVWEARNKRAPKPRSLKPCIVCGQPGRTKLCSAKCREVRKTQYKSQSRKTSPRKTPSRKPPLTRKVRINEIKEKNKILGPAKVSAWNEYEAALLAEHPELRGQKHRKLLMYRPTEPHLLELWHAYTTARNKLVENNINLARKLSTKYPDPDSYSICLEALIRAADKYDPDKSEFSTIATIWVSSFVGNYLRKGKVSIPYHLVAGSQALKRFVSAWQAKHSRLPTYQEITSNFQLAVPTYYRDRLAYIKKLVEVAHISVGGDVESLRVQDTPSLHEDILEADLTPAQRELARRLIAGQDLAGAEVAELRAALRGALDAPRAAANIQAEEDTPCTSPLHDYGPRGTGPTR